MRPFTPFLLATLLTASSFGEAAARQSAGGSQVACTVPMTWTVASVDPRFGLAQERAVEAAREAAALWEATTGLRLFRLASDGGHPIEFVHDERQAAAEARTTRRGTLDRRRSASDDRRAALERMAQEYDDAFAAYEADATAHARAVRDYENDLLRWGREPEVPDSVRRELDRRRDEIVRDGEGLDRRRRDLNRMAEEMQEGVRSFNDQVEALNREEAELERALPTGITESGLYDETVSTENGRIVSVSRRIRVFLFATYDDLVLVLAHELGHALGLGHAPESGAVMSEVIVSGERTVPPGGVTPADARMLRARCPDLGAP